MTPLFTEIFAQRYKKCAPLNQILALHVQIRQANAHCVSTILLRARVQSSGKNVTTRQRAQQICSELEISNTIDNM